MNKNSSESFILNISAIRFLKTVYQITACVFILSFIFSSENAGAQSIGAAKPAPDGIDTWLQKNNSDTSLFHIDLSIGCTLTSSPIIGNTNACYNSSLTISTTPSGGTSPYTYSLNGGSFVSSANRYFWVSAGTYYITVMDNLGCIYTTPSVTITQPASALSFTTTIINATCANATGSITISASGGYGTYSYSIDGGKTFQPGNSFTGLVPNIYYLVVKDANNCTATATANVKAPTLTATQIFGNTVVCYGALTTIGTTGLGGKPPYTYSIDATNNFVQSAYRYFRVAAGLHTITIMDSAGCTYTTPAIAVTQPADAFTFSAVQDGSFCTGNPPVGIAVTASGGYGGYSYSNNGGSSYQAAPAFSNLSYGNYTIAVKDQNGCAAASYVLKLAALTSSAIQGIGTVCPGNTTVIYTVPSGGAPPYSYSLDGGVFVSNAERYFTVRAGVHSITVKDNAGCTFTPASINIITVSCPQKIYGQDIKTSMPATTMFEVHVLPNPSPVGFQLQMKSGSNEDVDIIVTNIMGQKLYEAKGSVSRNYEFGETFTPGIYIVQVRRGNISRTMKLIKGAPGP